MANFDLNSVSYRSSPNASYAVNSYGWSQPYAGAAAPAVARQRCPPHIHLSGQIEQAELDVERAGNWISQILPSEPALCGYVLVTLTS